MEDLESKLYESKEQTFYSAVLNAWLNTKNEKDKQLLGISVTAIGLLCTLLRTIGVSSNLQLYIFGSALAAFLIVVILTLLIFEKNATYLESVLTDKVTESNVLRRLDTISTVSFIAGLVLVVIIGISSASDELKHPHNMASNKDSQNTSNQSHQNSGPMFERTDSFNGVAKLRPIPPKPQKSESQDSTSSNTSDSQTTQGQSQSSSKN